jgi:hypothetical protein
VPSPGVLIFFAIVGALICARARVAGGAVVFRVLAVVLFVATPAGAGLPGAVSSFLSTFDHATTPVLNGHGGAG